MAVLAGIVCLSMPPPAVRAGTIELSVYDDGKFQTSTSSSTSVLLGFPSALSTDHFALSIIGGITNDPGGATGTLSISSLSINSTSGGSHTLELVLSANGFTSPLSPTMLLSSSGSVSVTGTKSAGTISFQSFVDTGNTLWTTAAVPSGAGVTSTALQSSGISSSGLTNATAFSNTTATYTGGIPYSLTNVTTFASTSKGDGSDYIGGHGDTAVNTVAGVPAPGGVVLAASALPMLLSGWFLRRRKQVQLA